MWMSAHPLTSPVEKDTFVSMPQAITAVSAKLATLLMSSAERVLVSCTINLNMCSHGMPKMILCKECYWSLHTLCLQNVKLTATVFGCL